MPRDNPRHRGAIGPVPCPPGVRHAAGQSPMAGGLPLADRRAAAPVDAIVDCRQSPALAAAAGPSR